MIILFQFPNAWQLPNPSPFCTKLETYLRMTHQPYTIKNMVNVRKAPQGKLPFIKDQEKIISDSSTIIDYLKATYGDTLDQHLTPVQSAEALSIKRMIEEHLYWVIVYSRWLDDKNWSAINKTFFSKLPPIVKTIIPYLVRHKVRRDLSGQGLGRHTEAEIYALGIQDLNALSILLNDQAYFLGSKPSSLDASAFSFLLAILKTPLHSPLKAHMLTLTNLVDYCNRMWDQYYSVRN